MSSFVAKKLDKIANPRHTLGMKGSLKSSAKDTLATPSVRHRIERGGERLWRLEDFRDLSFNAAAQALSRLKREGALQRLSKGVYYRTRDTAFGKSRPNPISIRALASKNANIFPSGIAAANLLGFTTQTAKQSEIATTSASLPRKLIGSEAIVHTRRPAAWVNLSQEDAALLDFLRRGGRTSELSPSSTIKKTLALLSQDNRYERLLRVAKSEPPRVRALLGAMGQELGINLTKLGRLRSSLNPFSRFDFGLFSRLSHAKEWQAAKVTSNEAV
jgi:hypothetical protein